MKRIISLVVVLIALLNQSHGSEEEHDHNDELHVLLEELGVDNTHHMEWSSVTYMLEQLNETCLTTEDVQRSFPAADDGIDSSDFPSFAKLVIHYLQLDECTKLKNISDINLTKTSVCPANVSMILENIEHNERIPFNYDTQCFSTVDTIEDGCKTTEEDIDTVYIQLFSNLVKRTCILPELSTFVDKVFSIYDKEEMNKTEFSKVLTDLGIGESSTTDHEDEHAEEHEHETHDHKRRKRSEDDHDHPHDEDQDTKGLEDHDEDEDHVDEDDHDEDHVDEDDHDEDHVDEDDHDEDVAEPRVGEDHAVEDHDHEEEHEELASQKCYSSDEYISMALNGIGADSHDRTISKEGFQAVCPALVQQILSGACQTKATSESSSGGSEDEYTRAQKYGYGTLSVLIISLLAFVGLTVFKGIDKENFDLLMQFFVALGVGTLSGDAVLHIIPEVVGLHAHEAGEVHDHEGEEEEDKTYTWRLLMVIAGIYLFYLFENALKLWNQLSGSNIKFHDHSHDHGGETSHSKNGGKPADSMRSHRMTSFAHTNPACTVEEGNLENENTEKKVEADSPPSYTSEDHDLKEVEYLFWGITPLGVMVWLGDALHNFGDGIALGASFSSSWVSGVGTSIAIFCHELPHEFGDFAIYLQNGMSKWKALFMNFLAACFAFIGLYIGLSLSEQGETREWLLAIVAGMFLYISLVDIMHEIIGRKSSRPVLQFIVQNFGLLLGWAILLLLALYEEDIMSAFA